MIKFAVSKTNAEMTDLLYLHWHANPVIFQLGPLALRWYSLLFISGFILGWYILRHFFRREGVSETLLDPLLYTLLLGTIVGARLGHCLFYDFNYYFGSWDGFKEVFMPWKGGLASHGGTIALILAMIWFSNHYGKKNNFDFLWIVDHLVIAISFAACFIRLGNFFNSEIFGHVTSLPWGVYFDFRDPQNPRHPTQLYEALTYLILGLALMAHYKYRLKSTFRGFFTGVFFLVCFGSRFLLEYTKETSYYDIFGIDWMTRGQWLSIPFILIGIGVLVYSFVKKQPAAITK